MLAFGRSFYTLLGGRGGVLEQAMQYSHVLFSGAISIWLVNTLASVVRGTGDMRVPSVTLIGTALVQVARRRHAGARAVRPAEIRHGRRRRRPAHRVHAGGDVPGLVSRQRPQPADAELQGLQIPARPCSSTSSRSARSSCLSPLQTVLTVLIFTKILAGFGTETLAGYGMGSRLEFLLTPIAFAFGVASVPMVGMAMGAGLVRRARQVALDRGPRPPASPSA